MTFPATHRPVRRSKTTTVQAATVATSSVESAARQEMMCWDVDCESNTLRPTVSDLFSPSPGCWVRRWPSTTQPTTALSRCPLEVCHAFRAAFGDFAIHSRAILQGAAMRSPPGTRPNLTCLQQPRAHSNVVRTSARNAEPRCCSFFTFGVVQGSSAFRVLGLGGSFDFFLQVGLC